MTYCAIKIKHWTLRHYLWISTALLIIPFGIAFSFKPETWKDWVWIIAAPFAVLVTLQKQKTEELNLFKQLFSEFNLRYDGLNEALYAIKDGDESALLTIAERNKLFDYFNLCSEEFFYYRQGYIPPEIWKSWQKGMDIFFSNPRIRKLWGDESKTDSYYGFDPE